jgi:hypothetical protein
MILTSYQEQSSIQESLLNCPVKGLIGAHYPNGAYVFFIGFFADKQQKKGNL